MIFAPYIYSWSVGNSVYKIQTLMDGRNIGLEYITLAFVIGDSTGNITSDIYNVYDDITKFQNSGGKVILSFGGAIGPYLEDIMTEDEQYNIVNKLLRDTGIRMVDYDVEGAYLNMIDKNDQRNKVISKLQNTYSDLYVSYTLPVAAPSRWNRGGLLDNSIEMLKNAIQNNVNISIVNLMTMDYYIQLNKPLGYIACDIADIVKDQLKQLYPTYQDNILYNMIGITPMIGRNDDNSIFSTDDAKILVNCAIQKGLGLLSFWSVQRDQIGIGDLGIYSEVNIEDFEFTKIFLQIPKNSFPITTTIPITTTPIITTPTTIPITTTPIITTPITITHFSTTTTPITTNKYFTWQTGHKYKLGDIVIYNNNYYRCELEHTSLPGWYPDIVPVLWSKYNNC
jgi:chitinase